jgi:hypothetical protein
MVLGKLAGRPRRNGLNLIIGALIGEMIVLC